ncbi:replication initiation protein [Sporosarcina aquimarina]|uniref:Replication initiation protein n=1 Tax=Sporosarcina aquimarina TaxID=114975 RepID=A0ABU4G1U2_9BACL|nr:replication initiation protein [Sporosarcina aquimarina]MDW0110945.1 replication initiation protein [Sporosarcina aquimarina]
MNEKYVVTQSNNLIEARHVKPLSAREQKIILTMVSMIQPNDKDFKEYRVSIQEFSEMLGLKGHAKYEEIKEVALRLQEKQYLFLTQMVLLQRTGLLVSVIKKVKV